MNLSRRRRNRRAGFALADFLAGSMIFSATLTVFVALTRSKFDVLSASDQRSRAQAALERELDQVRLSGAGGEPQGEVDLEGFRLVRTFQPQARLPQLEGRVELRALRVEGASWHQLFEARVSVSWVDRPGSRSRLTASTVVRAPEGGQ